LITKERKESWKQKKHTSNKSMLNWNKLQINWLLKSTNCSQKKR
jgi:hypothetical protein